MMLGKEVDVCFYLQVDRRTQPYADLYTFEDWHLAGSVFKPDSGPPPIFAHEDGKLEDLPILSGRCRVGSSLFVFGGVSMGKSRKSISTVYKKDVGSLLPPPEGEGSGEFWRINGTMMLNRLAPKVLPYDDVIYIFGGNRSRHAWIEIYDPQTGKSRSLDAPEGVVKWESKPFACFLWAGGSECQEKPQVMVCVCDRGEARLLSYDVEKDYLQIFDSNFPMERSYVEDMSRNLIPYGNTLFIIDYAGVWTLYDLSGKVAVEQMQVKGLEKFKDRQVVEAFCQPAGSDGSLIFFIFMEPFSDYITYMEWDIPYAKVRVQCDGESFAAERECDGILDVGYNLGYSIFAVDIRGMQRR